MPTHELITNKNGTRSLREIRTGEVMHSNVGPRDEALLLYIGQSRLAERLTEGTSELVIWDVGLGAGSNALAALQAAREVRASGAKCRPLKIVSFENDVSGMALAYENREVLPFFEGFEPAVEALLSVGVWRSESESLSWELRQGDFLAKIEGAPAADIVFYDLYSPNVARAGWTVEGFLPVFAACAPGACFYTYSAATRVRSALLLAGFYVGYGRSTGAKLDTTAAARRFEDLERPLDPRWLVRLRRSADPLPVGWSGTHAELITAIEAHDQFKTKVSPLVSPVVGAVLSALA